MSKACLSGSFDKVIIIPKHTVSTIYDGFYFTPIRGTKKGHVRSVLGEFWKAMLSEMVTSYSARMHLIVQMRNITKIDLFYLIRLLDSNFTWSPEIVMN